MSFTMASTRLFYAVCLFASCTSVEITSSTFAGENAAAGCETQWLNYEPEQVELSGIIEKREVFGPPNYGENPDTDSRATILLLQLSEGINVLSSADPLNSDSYECVTLLHLAFSGDQPPPRNGEELNGHKVTISGKLFEAHTGHHCTNVLLSVDKITPGKPSADEVQELVAIGKEMKCTETGGP